MKYIWKNAIVEESEINIDIHDRGYQFGDGLYEVIRIYNGKLFTAKEHIDRLFTGAAKTNIELPFTKDELRSKFEELIAANGVDTGYVYMQVSRGDGILRDHHFPKPGTSTPVFTAFTKDMPRNHKLVSEGVPVVTTPDLRWLRCDVKTISLMGNVLAKDVATQHGVHEVIQHRDGIVTECSSSNLFIIKDGELWSHPDGNLILPGITKIVVIRDAQKLGIPVREEAFTLEQLFAADEVFLTSTTSEIIPIIEIDGKQVADGKRGPITAQLLEAYLDEVEAECGAIDR